MSYKKFHFKLSNYFDDKKFYDDESSEWVDFERGTLYNGFLQWRDLDGPKLISEPPLPRHELCNLIPIKLEIL